MDATELGQLCREHHEKTFIVVIRNPDGSVDRIGEVTVEPIGFYADGRIDVPDEDDPDDLIYDRFDEIYDCLVLERDPE